MNILKKQISPHHNHPVVFLWAAVALVSFLITIRGMLSAAIVPDTWLHMTTGRYILEHKFIPTHTDISFKRSDPALEWVGHSWLSDVVLYISGGADIRLGTGLLIPATLLLSLIMLLRIGANLALPTGVVAMMLIIGSFGAMSFWKMHPFIFLPALTLGATQVYILWKSTGNRRFAYALIGIALLWANISGGFVFLGILLILSFGVMDWVQSALLLRQSRHGIMRTLRMWILVITGSVIVTLCTPNGIRIPIYNVTVIGLLNSRKWYSTLGGALEATNSSNIKFAPSGEVFVFALIYCVLMLGTLSYLLVSRNLRITKRLAVVLPVAPFLLLPFVWIRFIPLSILTTLPLFGVMISLIHEQIAQTYPNITTRLRNTALGSALLLVGWFILSPPRLISFPTPDNQFDFFHKHELSQPLLVSTDIAGYAYFRTYPARGFIDAQDDVYDEHDAIAIFSAYNTIDESYIQELLKTYTFASLMVTKENDYLTGYFSNLPDWSLVYLDYNGILFVRNDTVSDAFLTTNALTEINFSLDLGTTPEGVSTAIKELERFTAAYPSTLAIGQLATMYRYTNQYPQAEKALKKIPVSAWNYVVKTEFGRIKAAQGLCKQAEAWFLDALDDRNEKNISRTTFDLAILYAVCLNDIPKAKHYFKRYTSYPIPGFERERATQLMKKFVSDIDTESK